MSTPQIDAVLFDYGKVLSLPPAQETWELMSKLSGLDPQTLHDEYWKYRHDYDAGVYTGITYWQQIAADTNRTYTPEQLAALLDGDYELWARPNVPMRDWALKLQSEGHRTGILSNIGDAMTERFLARLPWIKGFYHCTWSYTLKIAKPDAKIYAAAAASLETPPEHILFIDDIQRNIDAARAAGMNAILYTEHDPFLEEMKALGLEHLL